MPTLIALYGPQQVGKSTAAGALVDHHGFTRVAFADPLYRMVAALMDISVEAVRRLPKNEPLVELNGRTLRYALQTLGTEWGRDLMGPDVWIEAAHRTVQNLLDIGRSVVIDDMRFDNEYEMLSRMGCLFVRLDREDVPEQVNTGHASETAWDHFVSHAHVTNPPDGAVQWARQAGSAILAALQVSPPELYSPETGYLRESTHSTAGSSAEQRLQRC